MIDFWIIKQLLIGNTVLKHKSIHKITYEAEQLGHKSTVDYITIIKGMRYVLQDVNKIRVAELRTNHKLLLEDSYRIKIETRKLRDVKRTREKIQE